MRIPFGLTADGRMVAVGDVPRGRACECICPECKGPLQARHGDINVHHFAHDADPERGPLSCESGLESSIHRMAKQLIAEHGGLQVPGLMVTARAIAKSGQELVVSRKSGEAEWVAFDDVRLEHRLDPVRPDIVGYRQGRPMLIEVTFRHGLSQSKRQKLRDLGLPALELDLARVGFGIGVLELTDLVVAQVRNKRWVAHPEYGALTRRAREDLDVELRKVNEPIEQEERRKREAMQQLYKRVEEARRNPPPPPKPNGQPTNRWLRCESCRHVWSPGAASAADSPWQSAPCPKCDQPVSYRPA